MRTKCAPSNKFPELKTKKTSMKVTSVSLMRSDFGKILFLFLHILNFYYLINSVIATARIMLLSIS
ncbi:MAG: hypothetical protein J6M24_07345 [Lachnospiraceae bacterium]|nr:hypothetical protein [Lachnospiraceae bacterium]